MAGRCIRAPAHLLLVLLPIAVQLLLLLLLLRVAGCWLL